MDTTSRESNFDIVMVEDCESEVLLAREALCESGLRGSLRAASNRKQAIDHVRSRRPQLILLDLGLPGENGLAVLADLRARPESRGIPVIVLSGSADPIDIERSYGAGASAFVRKPADLDRYIDFFRSIERFWSAHVEVLQ